MHEPSQIEPDDVFVRLIHHVVADTCRRAETTVRLFPDELWSSSATRLDHIRRTLQEDTVSADQWRDILLLSLDRVDMKHPMVKQEVVRDCKHLMEVIRERCTVLLEGEDLFAASRRLAHLIARNRSNGPAFEEQSILAPAFLFLMWTTVSSVLSGEGRTT